MLDASIGPRARPNGRPRANSWLAVAVRGRLDRGVGRSDSVKRGCTSPESPVADRRLGQKETVMIETQTPRIVEILRDNQDVLLSEWLRVQAASSAHRPDLLSDRDLRAQCLEFVGALVSGAESGSLTSVSGPEWEPARTFLGDLSRDRATSGFTPSETAMFVFSIKEPLFGLLRAAIRDADTLATELWTASFLLDTLGLYTTEVFQAARASIISRQEAELLELSTPVVRLWDGIVGLPLIGTLDSARTQIVMQNLLQAIVDTRSPVAIIDITGVPVVDTLVAQHLLRTVEAARLMGARCVISGIRPQIAQTMVHLGVNFSAVDTRATLADALAFAFTLIDVRVSSAS
jgi:rsbT co-antagonist protein RsbR